MGTHLYCILPAAVEPPADLAGVAGAPVQPLVAGPVCCWASRHGQRPQPTAAAATAHHAVVHAALDHGVTPVPLRFGQWFADSDEAVTAIAGDSAAWLHTLERVAGCVEFGVRITTDYASTAARDVRGSRVSTGTAYMQALARSRAEATLRRTEGTALAADLAGRAGSLLREARTAASSDAAVLADIAHLVARCDEEDYTQMIHEMRRHHPHVRFRVSGPWAPWSFV
jgi:hypothetical protein